MSRCATVRLKPDTTSVTVLVLVVVLAFAVGCTPAGETATVSTRRPALQPLSMPDVTGAAESVQTQLRERHEVLLTADRSGAANIDLANAYGNLGKLLVAAEYLDAAATCFANAPCSARTPTFTNRDRPA